MARVSGDEPVVPLSRYRALERAFAGVVEDLDGLQRRVDEQARRLDELSAVNAAYDVSLGEAIDLARETKGEQA